MKNGDCLVKLNDNLEFGLKYAYGKEERCLNYIYTVAKLFINNFHFNNVFLKREDATNSVNINGASFDAILSRIPISIKNYQSSNINQNMEIAKETKAVKLKIFCLKSWASTANCFHRMSSSIRHWKTLFQK